MKPRRTTDEGPAAPSRAEVRRLVAALADGLPFRWYAAGWHVAPALAELDRLIGGAECLSPALLYGDRLDPDEVDAVTDDLMRARS